MRVYLYACMYVCKYTGNIWLNISSYSLFLWDRPHPPPPGPGGITFPLLYLACKNFCVILKLPEVTPIATNTEFFSVEEWRTNLMSLGILFHCLCVQHVSGINISIFRRLRLCCWVTTLVVLFSVRCLLGIWCGWVWVVSVLQAEASACFSLRNWLHVPMMASRTWR